MRLRLYTMERELGTADLLDGVTQKDVIEAVRNGQLFLDDQKPGEKPAQKPAPQGPKPTLPKAP